MKKLNLSLVAMATVFALSGCGEKSAPTVSNAPAAEKTVATNTKNDNAILAAFSGPYNGVPAFDKVTLSELKPAFDAAMAQKLAEVDAIANNPREGSYPDLMDGVRGMQFIECVIQSHKSGNQWINIQ